MQPCPQMLTLFSTWPTTRRIGSFSTRWQLLISPTKRRRPWQSLATFLSYACVSDRAKVRWIHKTVTFRLCRHCTTYTALTYAGAFDIHLFRLRTVNTQKRAYTTTRRTHAPVDRMGKNNNWPTDKVRRFFFSSPAPSLYGR